MGNHHNLLETTSEHSVATLQLGDASGRHQESINISHAERVSWAKSWSFHESAFINKQVWLAFTTLCTVQSSNAYKNQWLRSIHASFTLAPQDRFFLTQRTLIVESNFHAHGQGSTASGTERIAPGKTGMPLCPLPSMGALIRVRC